MVQAAGCVIPSAACYNSAWANGQAVVRAVRVYACFVCGVGGGIMHLRTRHIPTCLALEPAAKRSFGTIIFWKLAAGAAARLAL
jgi:hypothetical protein